MENVKRQSLSLNVLRFAAIFMVFFCHLWLSIPARWKVAPLSSRRPRFRMKPPAGGGGVLFLVV